MTATTTTDGPTVDQWRRWSAGDVAGIPSAIVDELERLHRRGLDSLGDLQLWWIAVGETRPMPDDDAALDAELERIANS